MLEERFTKSKNVNVFDNSMNKEYGIDEVIIILNKLHNRCKQLEEDLNKHLTQIEVMKETYLKICEDYNISSPVELYEHIEELINENEKLRELLLEELNLQSPKYGHYIVQCEDNGKWIQE